MPDVSQFGAYRFNEEIRFSEILSYAAPRPYAEGRFGLEVRVYEPHTNALKAIYSSDQDENPIESVEFEFLESGCGSFTIQTNTAPENLRIRQGDRIDIHLMHTEQPWFSGRITDLPRLDTTWKSFRYQGRGHFDILDKFIVEEEYQSCGVEVVVKDLAAKYLAQEDILFFSDRLMPVGYRIQHVKFDRSSLKDALKKLADLAHNWVFGVNENRELFFSAREGRPLSRYSNKASHWVGYNLGSFQLKEDAKDVVNTVFVKIGAISEEKSNFTDFTLSNLDSIAFYGERGKVICAPELKTQEDAELWADYQLEEIAWPKIKGRAKNLDLTKWVQSKEDLLRAEGFLRVSIARGGMVAPYYEPLNGYFRYKRLGATAIYGTNWLKRSFTCRKSGPLGRIEVMAQRVGAPGDLVLAIKSENTTMASVDVNQSNVKNWYEWVTINLDKVNLYAGIDYSIELKAPSGDASNFYRILYSSYDAPFSGGYYESSDGGSSWTEDTGKAIVYRSYLVHENEFILAVKKVKYRVTPTGGIMADIDVGEIDRPLEDRILNLLRELKAEQLLQQSNVAGLAT